MSRIHQAFQCGLGSVRLVDGEARAGVVSPAGVSVEFTHRHELNGGDAEPFQMVQTVQHRIEILGGIPVPDQQLVYDEAVLGRLHEVGIGPLELGREGAKGPHRPKGVRRGKWRAVRKGLRRHIAIIPGIQDERRVGVGDFNRVVHQIVEPGPGAGVQPFDLQPPGSPIGALVHQEIRRNLPAIEVSAQVNVVLGRGPKLEVSTVGGQYSDAILPGHGRIGHEPLSTQGKSLQSGPQKQTHPHQRWNGRGAKQKRRFATAHEP